MQQQEMFPKKDINPTVKVVISMNQDEREEFQEFAKRMNIPFSALVRISIRNFMESEGKKYIKK